ncbi:protein disulfide oxidoreductase [Kyrpidia tusciae]|nr:thioredoxin family protein [Kyrpidia tusciae]
MIPEKDRQKIRERFSAMTEPVVLRFFESSIDCPTCPQIKDLLQEVADLSDKLTLEVFNLYTDEEKAKEIGVDKAPTLAILGGSGQDYGIRFYGAPAGYEFAAFLEAILMISRGDSGLKAETKTKLATIDQDVTLNVFVTPTCPYCPSAVHLAHQFAFENAHIRGHMIEATEFPEWANRFDVYGVPKTVINDLDSIEGAVPEAVLLDQVMAVASKA